MKKYFVSVIFYLFIFSIFARTAEIIFINDFHGEALEQKTSTQYLPGMPKFMAEIKKEYNKDKNNTLILSGGDNYQGNFLSTLSLGAPVSEMFSDLHVSASAIGNHEFDWNSDFAAAKLDKAGYFGKWEKDGGFKYLAANIMDRKTGKPVTWAKPYEIFQTGGFKIALIGLCTVETSYTTSQSAIQDIQFADPSKSAREWVDYLKKGNDPLGIPDVIIALTHIPSIYTRGQVEGDEINKLVTDVPELNAVLSGHSHRIVSGKIGSTKILQAECYGKCIGLMKISDSDGDIKITEHIIRIKETDKIEPDRKGEEILQKYKEKYKEYFAVIGTTAKELNRVSGQFSSLGCFVAAAVSEKTGMPIAVINKGSLRNDIASGSIYLGDVISAYPFKNKIVTMKIKGSNLITILKKEQTIVHGVIPVLDSEPDTPGCKVISGRLPDGSAIDADKYYDLATSDFVFNGGDYYKFHEVKDVKYFDILISGAMADKIKKDCENNKAIVPSEGKYEVQKQPAMDKAA